MLGVRGVLMPGAPAPPSRLLRLPEGAGGSERSFLGCSPEPPPAVPAVLLPHGAAAGRGARSTLSPVVYLVGVRKPGNYSGQRNIPQSDSTERGVGYSVWRLRTLLTRATQPHHKQPI